MALMSSYKSAEAALLERHGPRLLALARASIAERLRTGVAMRYAAADWPAELRAPGAVFVTLTAAGALRGCVGTPVACRPLAEDVIDNAAAAAFDDLRFAPLTAGELEDIALALSLLSPLEPLPAQSETALLAALVPGHTGLLLSEGGRHALFLPKVWEALPDPRDFLAQLKEKAGLAPAHWSRQLAFQRFTAATIAEAAGG